MGNSQPSLAENLATNIDKNYKFVKKINDDRYGESKVLQSVLTRDFFLLKTYTATTSNEIERIYNLALKRKQIELATVIRVKGIEKSESSQYCSHYYKVHVLYEYCDKNLKREIEKRQQNKLYFSELEIYYLIDCVLSALISFFKEEIKHSDVRPHTVFVAEDGVFKLNDIQFMAGLNAYMQFLMGSQDYENCFLSPELFQQLGHRNYKPIFDQKADIFSLGMTVLQVATLNSIQNCYDFDGFVINTSILQGYLNELTTRYSHNFCELLRNMLELDPIKRYDYDQVCHCLSPYLDQLKDANKSSTLSNKPKTNDIIPPIQQKPAVLEVIDADPNKIDREILREINGLDDIIKEILKKSEETQNKYNNNEYQNIRNELYKDDYMECIAKRDEVIRKSVQARESITLERKKKNLPDERDILSSSQLYELYLKEYEQLRSHEY